IVELRGALNVYQVQTSRDDALEKFNPEKALKDLDNSLRANEASTKKAEGQKKDAQARVAALDSQADGLLKQSQGLRDQVVQLKARAQAASATEGLPLVQQAAGVSRQADGLDKQASYVKADAAGITPLVEAAERRLAQLADEAKQLSGSRVEVTKRAEAYAAQAKEARALADAASKDLGVLATRLDQLTATSAEMASAFEGAAKEYRDAVSKANVVKKNAGAEGKVSSSVQVAGYQQSLGDVLFARARVLQDIQTAYASLASTKPALPDAARYDASAKAASEEFAKVIKEAIETYTAAKDGFAGAGGSEAIRAKLDKLAELVGSIASKADGAIKPAAAPAEAAPAASEAGAPGASGSAKPGDDATVAAVRAMLAQERADRRSGNLEKVLSHYIITTDQPRELLAVAVDMHKACADLDAACTEKLSLPLTEVAKQAGPAGGMIVAMINQLEPPIDGLDLTPVGPGEVKWTIPNMGDMTVRLQEGAWKTQTIDMPDAMAMQAKTMGPMIAGVFRAVAAEVRAGTVTDAKSLAAL
ncbi:MAG: hypothetical protein K2X91_12525, partial [Thermoleophilia bacterium]|nr:hypothetical protein [Beijerinckiaceae bacterium]MBY0397273.1 hypothetical protein [Thermoleophilia bacterium]